ncbi:MAG: type II secretion system minor pseudopilin GspJ [Panacagrimonas sp.]
MARAPRGRQDHRGFTLIEIIVVVLVFSIMAAMAYGGLNSVLRTRVGIEQSMNRTAEMQRAFQRLRTDFQNLRDRASRDEFGDTKPPLVAAGEDTVTLIRGGWRNPLGAGRASIERVAYTLKDHKLLRSSWRVLDLPRESEPAQGTVLDNVEEARWRFMDAAGEWQTSWPVDDVSGSGDSGTESPPAAVELTLVTKDWGEAKFLFRTPVAGLAPALSAAAQAVDSAGGEGGGDDGVGGGGGGALLTTDGLLELDIAVGGLDVAGRGDDNGPGPDTPDGSSGGDSDDGDNTDPGDGGEENEQPDPGSSVGGELPPDENNEE